MGKQEQLEILKMLQEGKISVDEAERLLHAVEDDREEKGAHLSGLVETISKALSQLGLGNTWTIKEEIDGEFKGEGIKEIYALTVNGRIEVQGWNQPRYRISLYKTVPAKSEAEAKELAREMAKVDRGDNHINIQFATDLGNSAMRIKLLVPDTDTYNFDLSSKNGGIVFVDLNCERIKARTSNGRINAEKVKAADMKLRTSNGRIVLKGTARNLRAATSNGAVIVEPGDISGEQFFKLETSNGRIEFEVPKAEDLGVEVIAETSNSKVKVDLPDLEYVTRDERRVGSFIHAKTAGFEGRQNRLKIDARTSNGTVKVTQ